MSWVKLGMIVAFRKSEDSGLACVETLVQHMDSSPAGVGMFQDGMGIISYKCTPEELSYLHEHIH